MFTTNCLNRFARPEGDTNDNPLELNGTVLIGATANIIDNRDKSIVIDGTTVTWVDAYKAGYANITLTGNSTVYGDLKKEFTVNLNNTITVDDTSHLRNGWLCQVEAEEGLLPNGLSSKTDYWLCIVDGTTLKLCSSAQNAYLGTGISISPKGASILNLLLYNWAAGATFDATTDKIAIADADQLTLADYIRFDPDSGATLPSELLSTNYYYVIPVDSGHIKVATSHKDALDGNAINFSTDGSGTITLYRHMSILLDHSCETTFFQQNDDWDTFAEAAMLDIKDAVLDFNIRSPIFDDQPLGGINFKTQGSQPGYFAYNKSMPNTSPIGNAEHSSIYSEMRFDMVTIYNRTSAANSQNTAINLNGGDIFTENDTTVVSGYGQNSGLIVREWNLATNIRVNGFSYACNGALTVKSQGVADLIKSEGTYQNYLLQSFTVNTTTNVLTMISNRGVGTGSIVRVSNSGGALPSPLQANTDYYAIITNGDLTTMKLASSWANAWAGTAIDITTAGTGTQSLEHTEQKVVVEAGGVLNDYVIDSETGYITNFNISGSVNNLSIDPEGTEDMRALRVTISGSGSIRDSELGIGENDSYLIFDETSVNAYADNINSYYLWCLAGSFQNRINNCISTAASFRGNNHLISNLVGGAGVSACLVWGNNIKLEADVAGGLIIESGATKTRIIGTNCGNYTDSGSGTLTAASNLPT